MGVLEFSSMIQESDAKRPAYVPPQGRPRVGCATGAVCCATKVPGLARAKNRNDQMIWARDRTLASPDYAEKEMVRLPAPCGTLSPHSPSLRVCTAADYSHVTVYSNHVTQRSIGSD